MTFRRIFILPVLVSVSGSIAILGLFKAKTQQQQSGSAQLYLLSPEQLWHIEKEIAEVKLPSLWQHLADKNSLWKDELTGQTLQKLESYPLPGDTAAQLFIEGKRTFNPEITHDGSRPESLPREILPDYGQIGQLSLPLLSKQSPRRDSAETIEISGGLKLEYLLQGPVSSRGLMIKEITKTRIPLKDISVKLKFRLWIFEDGRVNQVIVEESSGFPEIDNILLKSVKKWKFVPRGVSGLDRYQWGIIKLRLYE